jgi:hypothetical protein
MNLRQKRKKNYFEPEENCCLCFVDKQTITSIIFVQIIFIQKDLAYLGEMDDEIWTYN